MSTFDLIIRNGLVVTPVGVAAGDVGVAAGRITALAPGLSGQADEEIEARGLHLFPGLIDAHLHFNEPGRAHWEGFETGSRALAAGGGTLFFDMPLNAHPPTIDAESFQLKLRAAQSQSLVDFAFWGGLVPQNLDRLEALAGCGVVGFKAFMASSGIEDFDCVDEATLKAGMKRAAQLNLPVAVHAESERLTRQLSQERQSQGRVSIRDYLDSRPVEAELEAIRRALDLAGETGCDLHVVHVSSGQGIGLITEARRRGVRVTGETCPHYLALTERDAEAIGATAKCAPPLRPADEQERLWERFMAGEILNIGSDHSPAPPELKRDPNFFKVWGGISGVQHTLPLLLTEAHFKRRATLSFISSLVSDRVATRFKLPPGKGRIAVGADADLALVDLDATFEIVKSELLYRHAQTPYLGRSLRGRVVRTLLRGQTVCAQGKPVGGARGRLVKPIL